MAPILNKKGQSRQVLENLFNNLYDAAMTSTYTTSAGTASPFGATLQEGGVNFSLHSKQASWASLALFSFPDKNPIAEIPLDPNVNQTGNVWHILVKNLQLPLYYAWRLDKEKGKFFKGFMKKENLLLDPHAKALSTSSTWGKEDKNYHPLGLIVQTEEFDWEQDRPLNIPYHELVIYEMHVRGFTKDTSSKVAQPGTFLSMIEKIPYLVDLGINAVKLLPIFEFNECEWRRFNPMTGERLYNFWGYSTVNYFSPMQRYASQDAPFQAAKDFKKLVKELHKNGIEVILDVVFNHTAEGNESGPILSFKGIDLPIYYMMDSHHQFSNYTGCGNTVNCNHAVVREFIRTSLQYWVTEMHVDGFRFDLAGIMMRGLRGEVLTNPPIIEELSEDPILANTKLIAEPWDCAGLYELGNFYPGKDRWSEWNDKYRDSTRRFIKGDRGEKREFAERISGSQDIFWKKGTPTASINFITAHDGFTLKDLVSYNQKNNSANAEDNRDGNPNNVSWNCGAEGKTEDQKIVALRERQMRNFHLALMISQGVPMVMMGNEYGHTRFANNNSWCQDNDLNWFLWDELEKNGPFYRFFKGLNWFRRKHPLLHLDRFLEKSDIDWHSTKPFEPDWEGDTQFIAFTLKDEREHLYVAFNMHHNPVETTLPPPIEGKAWRLIVHTQGTPPNDFFEEESAPPVESQTFLLQEHTAILLLCKIN
jgi:isoamylase/glycogen operon protein